MDCKSIKTYEDACAALNVDPNNLPDVSMLPNEEGEHLVNYLKLTRIVKAINGGWEPNYGDHEQRKYFPWFDVDEDYIPGSGGGFSCNVYGCTDSYSDVGSRLVFPDRDRAIYAGETFLDLYEKVHLIIK